MWQNTDLQNIIEKSSTVKSQAGVFAEWNLNSVDNFSAIGNYRYRHSGSIFTTIQSTYDSLDVAQAYTGATDSDVVINAKANDGTPQIFKSVKDKMKMYYSLQDCLGRFRPRSGINKIKYNADSYLNHTFSDMAKRPRFYVSDKTDKFKYWTSERVDANSSTDFVGLSYKSAATDPAYLGEYYIDDAAPFVVYKNAVPSNRLVFKMQTGVGTLDIGPIVNSFSSKTISDPFYGYANQKTPVSWKVQVLDSNNNWITVNTFDKNSKRSDGTRIIKEDGYVELAYGITNIPDKFKGKIVYATTYSSTALLPEDSFFGYAYLVKSTSTDMGQYYIWNGGTSASKLDNYDILIPSYGWYLNDEILSSQVPHTEDLVSPDYYVSSGIKNYREFQYINGIRLVIDTMNTPDTSFDLIEMSPRLSVNLTNKVLDFEITKSLSDLTGAGMPINQLLAASGTLNIFDYDLAFSANNTFDPIQNTGSIISGFSSNNLQIKFYDIVYADDATNYYVPIKTMYCDGFPEAKNTTREISIKLRDLFFLFETTIAPELFIPDASLSYIISTLLDSIGFSNYSFKRAPGEKDKVIPYFFVAPNTSIAQVLQDLALSTQSAMFFDENNNFIIMSANYVMPEIGARTVDVDLTLYGSNDSQKSGILQNSKIDLTIPLSNIIDISSEVNEIFNDGKINYTQRYIQKTYSDIDKTKTIDTKSSHRNWIYKPVLLWEISPEEAVRSVNSQSQAGYVLSAIPLSSDLSADLPTFDKTTNTFSNNIIDLGESAYWLPRYSGYLYANGEVIKYDAVQYTVSINGNATDSTVWISSVSEYVNYFSKLKFNGNIYPTGFVRIYAELDSNENVAKHGRGQFGTKVVKHSAKLDSNWTSSSNIVGCYMKSSFLFNGGNVGTVFQNWKTGFIDNNSTTKSKKMSALALRSNTIRNFLSSYSTSENGDQKYIGTSQYGTIQASAFVMEGPAKSDFSSSKINPLDFISATYKALDYRYKAFGTRMRIVGNSIISTEGQQDPYGSSQISTAIPNDSTNPNTIGGSSGGIGFFVNPLTNNGYYFEAVALTKGSLEGYTTSTINNLFLYKIVAPNNASSDGTSQAIPVTLWSSTYPINVDNGDFFGQTYKATEQYPTVFDFMVEYEILGKNRIKFYMYVNDALIGTIEDSDALDIYDNICLFIRGSSKVMFENVYALGPDFGNDNSSNTAAPIASLLSRDFDNSSMDAYKKFVKPSSVVSTYISGISPSGTNPYKIYYEEFGTIMREMAYINARFDKAFPAFTARITPTLNNIKGFSISGFTASPYGAEFLVFNITDAPVVISADSGSKLQIQGVTFTQESINPLTVDEFFNKTADFSNPSFTNSNFTTPQSNKDYIEIQNSRSLYGKKDFSLDTQYIQNYDTAFEVMKWTINKIMKPRRSIGVEIFPNPMIQLGDILKIDHPEISNSNNTDSRFVVYNIEYKRNDSGTTMNLYLSEVL